MSFVFKSVWDFFVLRIASGVKKWLGIANSGKRWNYCPGRLALHRRPWCLGWGFLLYLWFYGGVVSNIPCKTAEQDAKERRKSMNMRPLHTKQGAFFNAQHTGKSFWHQRISWKDRRKTRSGLSTRTTLRSYWTSVPQKVEPNKNFSNDGLLRTAFCWHWYMNTPAKLNPVQKWLATYVKGVDFEIRAPKGWFFPNMFFLSSFDWNEFPATLPSSFARIEERFLSLLYQGVWLVGRPSDRTCCASQSINSTPIKFP